MSKIIIVDSKDSFIAFKERDDIVFDDCYRVSALWVENSKGEILLAQRAFTKKNGPGLWWPAVAWTVEEREDYEKNMYKEAQEEIWLSGIMFELWPKEIFHWKHQYFCQWYFCILDRDITQFQLQTEEVENIQWVSKKELIENIRLYPQLYTISMTQSSFLKSKIDS